MVLEYLGIGLSLGITAGLSPGPLMALMISETIRGGMTKGIKVSLAPLFTDIPLILAIMFILKHIKELNLLLGVISLIGSSFLFYFGYRDIKTVSVHLHQSQVKSKSFEKGLLTNLLNPHPYIFWFFIGVPILINVGLLERVIFVASFLFGIVGSKICLTALVERGKMFIENKHYQRIIKFLGLLLIFFGLLLLKNGIGYLYR
jgi:threonine/homoserine/homoserine lactone efflux protein